MQLSELSDDFIKSGSFANTIHFMRQTAFHKWGFCIYRASQSDDDLFQRYLAAFDTQVREYLVQQHRDEVLEQFAEWTIMDTIGGQGSSTSTDSENVPREPSKAEIRRRFVEWRDQHQVRREESALPLPDDASSRLPRFTYCLYIDQKCLDSLEPHLKGKAAYDQPGSRSAAHPPPLVAVLIDGDFQTLSDVAGGGGARPRRSFSPVEGGDGRYVGWEYCNVRYLPAMYDELHLVSMSSPLDYARPPAIAPGGFEFVA